MAKPTTYFELWVEVPISMEDLWSSFCFESEAVGIETVKEFHKYSIMRIFFEEGMVTEEINSLPERFAQQYPKTQPITLLEVKHCPYEDWQSSWHKFFKPLPIGKSFTVCPPWNTAEVLENRIPIIIDPGQGFGTGYHPSTVLAMEVLEHYILHSQIIPEEMIDVGIGSGILAFAGCHLGVQAVHGVDIDFEAVRDVKKNSELNGLSQRINSVTGTPACLEGKYSIVISNMLLSELFSVKDDLVRLTASNGVLICSGFLDTQAIEFEKTFKTLGMYSDYIASNQELRASIEAYGKGKKLIIVSKPTDQAKIFLREYSLLALHTYKLRNLLKIPRGVVANILSVGTASMSQLSSNNPRDVELQTRLSAALMDIG